MRTNAGYVIIRACSIDSELEVVMGAKAGQCVTWLCKNGEDYFWGHYFPSFMAALSDFGKRITEETRYVED